MSLPQIEWKPITLWQKVKRTYHQDGIGYMVQCVLDYPPIWYHWALFYRKNRTFEFRGNKYHYMFHRINKTYRNERAVELPIFWKLVQDHSSQRIMEVGHVLRHYYPANHLVVDKFEKAEGVINQDVVDISPDQPFDLIISISTIEHVGWDETPRDPDKIPRALANLQKCLAPGGSLVVSLPIGYNEFLDDLLRSRKLHFSSEHYLKRVSWGNDWVETVKADAMKMKYRSPYPGANALLIAFLTRD